MDVPETPVSDAQMISDAGDRALEAIDKANETPAPAEPTKAAEPDNSPAKPEDQGQNDKLPDWLKGMDEKAQADIRDGKLIPKHRMDEVLTRSKAYEAFGSPEELQAKLTQLAQLTAKNPPAAAPKSDKAAELTDEDKQMKEYLLSKIAPELSQLPDIIKKFEEMAKSVNEQKSAAEAQQKAAWDENVKAGDTFIRKLAQEAGLPIATERGWELIRNGVLDCLHADDATADKFYKGRDTSVLKAAFDDYQKVMFSGIQRKAAADLLKDKKSQADLPKPPAKGPGPTELPDKPAETLSEAGDRAWASFQ